MIKKNNKRIIALALSAVMLFSMAGCGKNKKNNNTTEEGTTAEIATGDATEGPIQKKQQKSLTLILIHLKPRQSRKNLMTGFGILLWKV